MLSASLLPHPGESAPPITALTVELCPDPAGGLTLHYRVFANPAALVWPSSPAPQRRDGLWQHTCFEVFLARRAGPTYREFNFSPAEDWACYDFSDIRQALPPPALAAPVIRFRPLADGAELTAHLTPAHLPAPSGELRLGLSAVLETPAGGRSYWALAHPAAQPDFHQRAAFTLALPAL